MGWGLAVTVAGGVSVRAGLRVLLVVGEKLDSGIRVEVAASVGRAPLVGVGAVAEKFQLHEKVVSASTAAARKMGLIFWNPGMADV